VSVDVSGGVDVAAAASDAGRHQLSPRRVFHSPKTVGHPEVWGRMIHESAVELQSRRDICRAVFLIALAQGLTREQSAEALRYRAAAEGSSLHAAALALLAPKPTDHLPTGQPARTLTRRHLHALRSPAVEHPTSIRN
jgi:hypothetical protein